VTLCIGPVNEQKGAMHYDVNSSRRLRDPTGYLCPLDMALYAHGSNDWPGSKGQASSLDFISLVSHVEMGMRRG
jgi:hypothetical protein